VVRSGEMLPGEPFDALCKITSLSYERGGAAGYILLVGRGHPALTTVISLERTVPLHKYRAIRKLLETTDSTSALLCDGRDVYGLGSVDSSDHPDVFAVTIPAHATWQFAHNGRQLMRVSYGSPSLPQPLLDRAAFADALDRVLGAGDIEPLWRVIEAAASAGHGATVVVSAGAAMEALRCWPTRSMSTAPTLCVGMVVVGG
ncbi:MAG TPA: hypothetical protein VMZ73_10745, partial [Acidimicrobiales bacterium]|nr:hypothetical protein [Acidimicrobiales bacterium]